MRQCIDMKNKILTKNELKALRARLPKRYVSEVQKAYYEQNGAEIGERTIFRFFAGTSYSELLHSAILHVAEVYQTEWNRLSKRTNDILSRK